MNNFDREEIALRKICHILQGYGAYVKEIPTKGDDHYANPTMCTIVIDGTEFDLHIIQQFTRA